MRPSTLDILVRVFGPLAIACAYFPLVVIGVLSELVMDRPRTTRARAGTRPRRPDRRAAASPSMIELPRTPIH